MLEEELFAGAVYYFFIIGGLAAPAYAHWALCPIENDSGDKQRDISLFILFVALVHLTCGIVFILSSAWA
jgi:hypothetical protein